MQFYQKKPFFLFFFLSLSISNNIFAQFSEEAKVEFPIEKRKDMSFEALSFAEKGILLFLSEKGESSTRKYIFRKYDKNLNPVWIKEYVLDNRFTYKINTKELSEDKAYFLFYQSPKRIVAILQVDFESGELDFKQAESPVSIDFAEMQVFGKNAFIVGEVSRELTVLDFSFFDNKIKIVPDVFKKNLKIRDLSIDYDNVKGYIVAKKTERRSECDIVIKSFQSDGKLIENLDVKTRDNQTLIFAKHIAIKDKQFLVATYGENCKEYANGLAFVRVSPDNQQEYIKYISFSDLQNFFKYMPKGQQKRTYKRIEKQRAKGKDVAYRYSIILHDLIKKGENIVVVGEAYETNTQNNMNNNYYNNANMYGGFRPYGFGQFYNPYSAMSPYNNNMRPSFTYSHAFMVEFDQNGKIVADNILPLDDMQVPELQRLVTPHIGKTKDVFFQLNTDQYKISSFKGNDSIFSSKKEYYRNPNKEAYQSEKEEKKARIDIDDASITSWYDDYFVLYGISLKNPNDLFSSEKYFHLKKMVFTLPKKKRE